MTKDHTSSYSHVCLLALLLCLPLAANATKVGAVFRDCPDCPEMVVIPAGNFDMGSNNGGNEMPVHRVILAKPFAMGKTEVTQGQWRAIMGNNPSGFTDCGDTSKSGCVYSGYPRNNPSGLPNCDDTCPVEQVNWDDARAYIQKLNAKTGKQYRLPSEAEWEYAARAGTTTAYPWGEQASHEYANYGADKCCDGLAQGRDKWVLTSPAGSFPANAFGLYDMIGNVWEWTEDSYHNNYTGAPIDGSAWLGGTARVVRGGSWYDLPQDVRVARRFGVPPALRNIKFGFRLVRILP